MNRAKRWALHAVAAVAGVGLLVHAHSYDFFADDAYITLRYGQQLWKHGAPVYNVGEHVEGYTSPLWMLLAAVAHAASDPVAAQRAFGAAAALLWIAGLVVLWRLVRPGAPAGGILVVIATALSCPVAAWTLGGLETPLFGALLTWSIATVAATLSAPASVRRALGVAFLLFLTTLARPEGVMTTGILVVVAGALGARAQRWRPLAWMTASYAALVATHVAWRLLYYGYPLPNTFYLKSSGESAALMERGVAYLRLAASELSWGLVALAAIALLVPALAPDGAGPTGTQRARRAALWSCKLVVVAFLLYLVRIGGDFLDLYRFLAPVLPLAFTLIAAAGHALTERAKVPWAVAAAVGLSLCGLHGFNQIGLRERALRIAEESRRVHGIEPLGWTRLYALRWAATGRWVASVAAPGDWMAVGAAGAMPYYAGISNLDTFGLCDAFVAHDGSLIGSRPGHQRFAPFEYIMRRRPTFVFVNDYARDRPERALHTMAHYRGQGYRLVEAHVTTQDHGAPSPFYHYLYMREDRALELSRRPHLRVR